MIDLRSGRYALGVCVAVAMLGGCGGQASNGAIPSGVPDSSLPHHKTFNYTGAAQDFTVPAGVTQLDVVARGAKGGGFNGTHGGRVHADIPVTPGERLVVYVGGDASKSTGGFNGGGSSGYSDSGSGYSAGYAGGGASDVREGGDGLANRILVVGGGGGKGGGDYPTNGTGGKGGGKTGGAGAKGTPKSGNGSRYSGGGGGGGTQGLYGGAGGSEGTGPLCYGLPGDDGTLGEGGTGASEASDECGGAGGGGGGGYYGGGGGGSGAAYPSGYYGGGGGGGGGSSYVERKARNVHMWQGWKNPDPNGLVVISWQ
jgi:hypothetical protein